MNALFTTVMLSVIGVWIALLAAAACEDAPAPVPDGRPTPEPGARPNASVTGSVTYRERLALSPGATLIVQLRDVSLQDAASILIAEQVIPNPGQVPIAFKIEYNRDNLNPRNTYAVNARIIESDGRLAFTNDTAYDVVTRGNPNKVNMLLVMVEPPPDPSGDSGNSGRASWVEAPVPVVGAQLLQHDSEFLLLVAFHQSRIEGCVRPGGQELEMDGSDIIVTVTLQEPPPAPWRIPCADDMVEVETVVPIDAPLTPGQTYRVKVNGVVTNSFTLPEPDFRDSFINLSPIESVEVTALESAPPQYELRVVSGLPKGSGCSRFNGYEVRRADPTQIEVAITHHEIADPSTFCTTDYPIAETSIPLGSDFEPGLEYTVSVNSKVSHAFLAH